MFSSDEKRLLLVEDEEAFATVLARSLSQRGFAVRIAADGMAALEQAQQFRPQYVILDLNLNGMSGLNLIEPILGICAEARLVVLTGYASIATAVNAIKRGAVEYLAKPTGIGTLVSALLGPDGSPQATTAPAELLTVQSLEWEYIQRILAAHGGNITATAYALKMHRRTLQRKLSKKRPNSTEI